MLKMRFAAIVAGALSVGTAAAQSATASVRLNIEAVPSNTGEVVAVLCGDSTAAFPNSCVTYHGKAPATPGQTVVTIHNVVPGTYAVLVFQDENGNGRPDIPPEGYAFGNNAPWPPTFESASIRVSGDTAAQLTLVHVGAGAAVGARHVGSHGAPAPTGVSRVDLRTNGLYGEFYVPAGATHAAALLLLGGSEGGLDTMSLMATSFAEEGFPTLALAYWGEQGLPQTLESIPLEYFDQAVAWLKTRSEVDPRAIGALGWSRGSEAALLLASRNKDVHAVVAVAPSSVVWLGLNFANITASKPAWLAGGKPLPYLKPSSAAYRPDQPMRNLFNQSMGEANRLPQTAIPVERINGAILLISGADDHLWPSERFADRIIGRLQAVGFQHAYEQLSYAGAGHLVFVGASDGPMARANASPSNMMGGSAEGDAVAWADDWPKTLAFLRGALHGSLP